MSHACVFFSFLTQGLSPLTIHFIKSAQEVEIIWVNKKEATNDTG